MARHPDPPDIARLKGNPRKRKLARGAERSPSVPPDEAPPEILPPDKAPALADLVPPAFLTDDAEREIFLAVAREFLPRNLVRPTDFNVLGRYASYMRMWIRAKEQLNDPAGNPTRSNWYKVKSKHVPEGLLRRHPAFQDMLDLGAELAKLEPQLGLTPLSRNAIMQRFMRGGFDPAVPPGPDGDQGKLPMQPDEHSALGYLARATTAGQA